MDNPGEILRLCRLCLVKDQVNIPIFEDQGDIRQTFLKIRSCLPVKVSRDDKLPKKICGGCSNKLDLFYEFWSSTANSEKTLQSWLGQEEEEEEDDKMQEITKPVEALVKEESEALEDGHAHDQSFDEATKDEAEAPPAKRARRTAAVKAQINISHDSDEDEDVDGAEPITKIEDESDDSDGEEKDPSYTEVPGTSADDQAGPSGLGKDGVEAPTSTNDDGCPNVSKLTCDRCKTVCVTSKKMETHLARHHGGFLCKICFKQFIGKGAKNHLMEHWKSHHKVAYVCCHCEKRFKEEKTWVNHMRIFHSSKYIFRCKFCLNTFQREHNLMKHYKLHAEKEIHLCKHCNDVFLRSSDLHVHISTQHLGKKLCSCRFCGKEFSHDSFLLNHISLKHGNLVQAIKDIPDK